MTNKKINLTLVGLDGNAFALMGAFQRQAKKEGWSSKEINEVFEEAQKGDYYNLVRTLAEHCQEITPEEQEEMDLEREAEICRMEQDANYYAGLGVK